MECVRTRELVMVAGVPFDNLDLDEAAERVLEFAHSDRPHYVATANVNFIVRANRDPEFMEVIRMADMITPDGMPVVWASELLGSPLKARVTGVDLVYRLAAMAADRGLSIFFLGGRPEVAERAAAKLKTVHPGLRAGAFAPDFDEHMSLDSREILSRIRDFAPDLLFVSLGAGKAEKWIRMHLADLGAGVAMGVGAAVDFVAGERRRAPAWIRERGLEWLHRMALEPRRLGRRYLSDFFSFTYFSYRQRYHQAWRNRLSPRRISRSLRQPGPCARLVSMALSGRLDYLSAPGLRRTAEDELRRGGALLLDLSALEFIDSSGLGVLAGLEKLARELEASLYLAAPGEKILATMRQARLDAFLTLVRDEAEACSLANDPASHPLIGIEPPLNGSLTVSLSGRIDSGVSRRIEDSLQQLSRDRAFDRMVLDMRGVSFIDSSGVGALLALDTDLRSRGKILTVRNLNGSPARTFKLLGLGGRLGLEPH